MSDWRPLIGRRRLQHRARALRRLREFFDARGVVEVETPALLEAVAAESGVEHMRADGGWLRSSPESMMKRLLAAEEMPIYQIGKVWRRGEFGRWHRPEFTMLEWYRPRWDARRLREELMELVAEFLEGECQALSYGEVFEAEVGLDPHRCDTPALLARLPADLQAPSRQEAGRAFALQYLFSHRVQPAMAGRMLLVVDFPQVESEQAALDAAGEVKVAKRFELFVDAVEVANGAEELRDAAELRKRLESRGRDARLAPDEALLAALSAGLPPCAGAALGVDRLLALALGEDSLAGVMAF